MVLADELSAIFCDEADQILGELAAELMRLQTGFNLPSLRYVYRLTHNLRGSADAIGLEPMARVVEDIEAFLVRCGESPSRYTAATYSTLRAALQLLRAQTAAHRALRPLPDGSDIRRRLQG